MWSDAPRDDRVHGGQDRSRAREPRGYVAHIFIKVPATEATSFNAANVIHLRALLARAHERVQIEYSACIRASRMARLLARLVRRESVLLPITTALLVASSSIHAHGVCAKYATRIPPQGVSRSEGIGAQCLFRAYPDTSGRVARPPEFFGQHSDSGILGYFSNYSSIDLLGCSGSTRSNESRPRVNYKVARVFVYHRKIVP